MNKPDVLNKGPNQNATGTFSCVWMPRMCVVRLHLCALAYVQPSYSHLNGLYSVCLRRWRDRLPLVALRWPQSGQSHANGCAETRRQNNSCNNYQYQHELDFHRYEDERLKKTGDLHWNKTNQQRERWER